MPSIDPNWWITGTHEGEPLHELLAAHEFGKVFAFLRTQGWTFGAISARTGLDEYRIREHIRGTRQIEKHRVIERIADGLEIDRRLCRVGDMSNADPPPTAAQAGGRDDNADELRERLDQARNLDGSGLLLLEDHTNQIRRIDRTFGAQAADLELRGHLETLLKLRSFSLSLGNRARLAELFCDAACLAGWVALDMGDVTAAWRHHEAAKDAGRESGSSAALAHATAQQGYVLLDIGDVEQAVELADHALNIAAGGRDVPPVLLAWLWAVAGEMHAVAGHQRPSDQAFERAAELAPGEPTDPSVPYVMLNGFHLARWRGAALARLGEDQAIDEMHFALTGMDVSWTRARAQLHVDLAYSLVAAHHEDQALRQLQQAQTLAARVGSRRQKRRAHELDLSLRRAV